MIIQLHFFLLNDDFSPEYADANHQGRETENNPKYEWEDELEIKEIERFEILRKETIPMEGQLPNDEVFSVQFENMCVIELVTLKNEKARLGVSESILENFVIEENGNETKVSFFIKDFEPHGNPVSGIYVASKEFPKELIY